MKYEPLKLHPCYKEYLWGGSRLKTDFYKEDAPAVTAESWELADHPDGSSVIENGAFAGKTLSELAAVDREGFLGERSRKEAFPILVKLIDACRDLSIQVHPSDATALPERGEQGKAEMWYVVDCAPQAFLYYGFSRRVDREEFLRRAQDGSICQVLNRVPVKKGDVFYILPGTIHAIGAGILIAEIQQNSNTTFRVYDYQRKGADGKLRPLHLERAASVIDYEPIIPAECRMNNSSSFAGFTMSQMFACQHFKAYCLEVRESAGLCCDGATFQHLLCVEGEAELRCGANSYHMRRGESFFLPAKLGAYQIKGASKLLLSCL